MRGTGFQFILLQAVVVASDLPLKHERTAGVLCVMCVCVGGGL